jgi:steroid 5-alpha reductase family enzyme
VSTLTAIVALAAAGWALAAIVMAALWRWHLRLGRNGVAAAAWPLVAGGLAVFYANVAEGAWARRSAIAWMLGSWGARLGVYWMWDRVFSRQPDARLRESASAFQRSALIAVFFSLPAMLTAVDPEPMLGVRELAATGLWLVGFAGETTADRQLVRWRRAGNEGECTSGVWRYMPRAHDLFELVTWSAHALFASASPFGWAAIACPVAIAFQAYRDGTRRAQL